MDLLIARSGEGTIGKAALYTDDLPVIYSDFTMRVRFKPLIIPEFGYIYCCSRLFQLQVEQAKRGMGNMTNFFPYQLNNLLILCPPIEQQRAVVSRVNAALAELEAKLVEFRRIRDEIDGIVYRVITRT